MDFYSPLRYPGGKGKVANYFKKVVTENELYDGYYVEPYAGGASVGLSLLFNEYVSKIIINDIDKSIYSFWYSVLHDTERLCKLIYDTPVTMDVWRTQKEIQKNKSRYGNLRVGFSTFFLNRTNRSGIISAGVIGGVNQLGNWKIDARFNKADLIKRIERIADYKNRIEIYGQDAIALIDNCKRTIPHNSLYFIDPPYFVKGKELYLNYYNLKDHEDIANSVADIDNQKWIVTYDNVEPIRNLYKDFRKVVYNLNYSAGKIGIGEELMIFSNNLNITES